MHHRERRADVRDVHVKTTCDSCGADIKSQPSHGDFHEADLHVSETKFFRVSARAEEGERSGHGDWATGSVRVYDPDICFLCFRNKVIPFLESIGVKVPWHEVDW